MKSPCESFEEALLAEDGAGPAALAAHAEGCDACRSKALLWQKVDDIAPSLKKTWESPELLPRIREAAAQSRPRRRSLWLPVGIAAAIAVYAAAGWISLQNQNRVPYQPDPGLLENERARLLSEETLNDVEKKEAAFVASIDALERRASPALEAPASPLAASLKEKLVLLDSAIADCRREIARNEFNTNLRRELLAMYQEKKQTLQEIARENGDKKS